MAVVKGKAFTSPLVTRVDTIVYGPVPLGDTTECNLAS